MNRLFIADPSLKDIRGHHYMMTREATRSARLQGFEAIWLCSAAFSSALDRESAIVAPVFKASMYDAYMSPEKQAGGKGLFARLARKLRGAPPVTAPFPSGGFYEDLQSAMAQWEIGPQDRILLHTADGESLPAIARIVSETPLEALPVFHMATPYDPVGVMPKRQGMESFAATLKELKAAGKLDSKLFLYAENAYLAEHLSALWKARVRPLPIPASPPPTNAATAARATLSEKLNLAEDSFIVVSLGSARLEKGFHKIPDIAEEVFARVSSSGGEGGKIRFILHASAQIIGRDPQIAKALDVLAARPETEVTLLLDPLSDDEYQTLLHASDVVLLPYGKDEYRVRGSAVVTEALAAGKTIVATANTYPGKAAAEHGGLTAETAAEFAAAVLKVHKERDAFRAQAARESERFIADNTMENYWPRCLAAEQQAMKN